MSFQRLTAWQGCEYVDGAKTGKQYYGFIVNTEATITVMQGGYPGTTSTDYLTEIGLSGKTLSAGTLIVVPEGKYITNLTVSSGSVIAYS